MPRLNHCALMCELSKSKTNKKKINKIISLPVVEIGLNKKGSFYK